MPPKKLLRITTVPISLHLLLRGQFRFMREQGYDVYTMSAEGKEIQEVVKEGVPHIIVPFTRQITPIQDLVCLFKLISIIRKMKPHIVHTHTPKAGLLGMMAAWICGVPVRLHTVAGLPLMESKGIKRAILTAVERITYACANKVYANSKGLRRFIVDSLGASKNKIHIIGEGSSNGIDSSFFSKTPDVEQAAREIRNKHQVKGDHFVFAFVGRIVNDKGISELIEAFKEIRKQNLQKRFVLLLVGPFEQELDPLRADDYTFLNDDPDIILAGFQKDVRPWIAASNAFIFPSYREGFPNVVMQACCLEVPCVVSDINGCNEIVRDHKTGLIVPVKDWKKLYEAMNEIMTNDENRNRYGRLARQHVVANFDQQYVWSQLLSEYQQLAGSNQ